MLNPVWLLAIAVEANIVQTLKQIMILLIVNYLEFLIQNWLATLRRSSRIYENSPASLLIVYKTALY